MPPKRKSPDGHSPPPNALSKRSGPSGSANKRTRQSTSATGLSKPHSTIGSLVAYQAFLPSPEHIYAPQLKTCAAYRNPPDGFEKCMSCIEKQTWFGGCRFIGIRAFQVIGEATSNGRVMEDDGTNEQEKVVTNQNKSKPKSQTNSKKPTQAEDSRQLDFTKWAFPSNQPDDYIPFSSLEFKPETAPSSEEVQPKKFTSAQLPTRPKRSTRGSAATAPSQSLDTPSPGSPPVPTRRSKTPQDTSPATLQKQSTYALTLIAPTFASQLLREKAHESIHLGHPIKEGTSSKPWASHPRPLARISPTPEARSICDLCATTIFLGSYLCGVCGREYCLGCWEEWVPGAIEEPSSSRKTIISSCSRRRRHGRESMVFITRAVPGEVESLLSRVEKYSNESTQAANIPPPLDPIPTEPPYTSTLPVPPPDSGVVILPKFLPLPKIHFSSLTLPIFQSHWLHSRSVPLVVTGLLDCVSLSWDDSYFVRHHGHERCLLHDTSSPNPDTDPREGHVRDFFLGLNDARLRRPKSQKSPELGSWKLKDWPPRDDFAAVFPELFEDFERAVPAGEYSTRKGWLNLASRGPKGWVRPDLGPKMYCAYPAVDFLPQENANIKNQAEDEEKGETKKEELETIPPAEVTVRGTTNLHLDMTDAVNLMVYTSPNPPPQSTHFYPPLPSSPSIGAIWDIFPPSTAPTLRSYLRKKHPNTPIDDPIHRQIFYLDEWDLRKLKDENGVSSWRIYQSPGEAVFIPAGCPHQVRNTRGGVKVAVDFLSPEGVAMCAGLLEEGRRLAGAGGGTLVNEVEAKDEGEGEDGQQVQSMGKREDVLQLWNCLYYSWAVMERVVVSGDVGGVDALSHRAEGEIVAL